MAINVGDTVRVQRGLHAGEIHTVERVRGSQAWIQFSGLPDAALGTSPYPIKYLTKLDSPTFDVGDRVTGAVGSLKGEKATVVGTHRHWVKVRMDLWPSAVRYYLPSDLVHLAAIDAGTFKVGDRVTGKENALKGQKATVVGMNRDWVQVRSDSRPGDVRHYRPSELAHLDVVESDRPSVDTEGMDTNINHDAGTFMVGDRVTRTDGVYAGVPARVVAVYGQMVDIRPEAQDGPNGYYNRSVLKLVDVEGADTNAKTEIRVVAFFSSPGTQKIEMVFYDAREADVWIDYLKNAPGVTTVTRDTTETFTRNNA